MFWYIVAHSCHSPALNHGHSHGRCTVNTHSSQAFNFCDLSRITELNTREFFELPITINVTAVIWYAIGKSAKLKCSELSTLENCEIEMRRKNSVLQYLYMSPWVEFSKLCFKYFVITRCYRKVADVLAFNMVSFTMRFIGGGVPVIGGEFIPEDRIWAELKIALCYITIWIMWLLLAQHESQMLPGFVSAASCSRGTWCKPRDTMHLSRFLDMITAYADQYVFYVAASWMTTQICCIYFVI